MRILKTNRDGIFILYIIVTLLFSVVIYAEHGQKLAGVIGVALFPLIGSFFYLNDLKNALKAIFSLIFITTSLGLGAGASCLLLYLQLSLEVALVVGCVLSVSILFFLFYNSVPSLLAQKLSNFKAGREKQEEPRMTYHKYKSVCYNAWYQALPSSISNQTKAMAGFRIAAMVICITTGFWGIFLRPVLIFGGEPVFDSLLCIAMMLSGVLIFFCGFFAALLGALCLCALIGLTLLIHRPLDAMNLSAFSHNLFTSLIAAASCGLPIAFI